MSRTAQDVRESLPRESGISAWLNVNVRFWRAASLAVAAVVAAPIVVVVAGWLSPAADVWSHLIDTVLLETIGNTLGMLFGVGSGVLLIGVSLAWLTTMCDFPGRRWFDWALMLPLALPAYVLAFVAIGLFDYSGPVQSSLRALFGTSAALLPPIRSLGGLIAVMTLAFYPYVYMLARTAFVAQGRSMLETGRVDGPSRARSRCGPRAYGGARRFWGRGGI